MEASAHESLAVEPLVWADATENPVAAALSPDGPVDSWRPPRSAELDVYACEWCDQLVHQTCRHAHEKWHASQNVWRGARRVGDMDQRLDYVEDLEAARLANI